MLEELPVEGGTGDGIKGGREYDLCTVNFTLCSYTFKKKKEGGKKAQIPELQAY